MKGMTLGSLFDGSGGFPLAGTMNGMTPIWASEIEPYPLRVTAARFPDMKQLGDVTKIDGAGIEPVDVITFGSPCQDLSVAGKQTGIHDGKRSSLFFEAVRIIREMRGATNGKYPRFAVWENVPGAFSSNKGADFRAVLQALCEIAAPDAAVPEPPKRKWEKAGCIVGDGYSIAWRVYDAQYWGVPKRRKRIYLVADFGSERAGEILFEREGVRRDSAQGREAWEGTADDAAGGAEGSDHVKCLTPWDCQSKRIYLPDGVYPTLPAMDCGGANNQALIYEPLHQNTFNDKARPCVRDQTQASLFAAFMGGQGSKAGSIGYSEQVSPTLKSVLSGGNTVPDVVYPEKARTLAASHDSSPCIDRGKNIICIEGDGNARAHIKRKLSPCMKTIHPNTVIFPNITGSLCANSHPGSYTGQDAFNDMLPVYRKDRRYIVRRLTPLECCRLQGFPDWWEDGANGSDSARYKMWGNGIALPCAADVMRRIAKEDACNT